VNPLVVFDLDGTLVDSRRDLTDAANALLEIHGAAPLDEETVGRMVGEGAATLVARLIAARGIDADPAEALSRFLALYDERLLVHTRPYDGMPGALAQLREWAQLAVLTNKPAAATERLLDALGLRPTFRWVIGGDTPIGRKPDPSALLLLIREAGAAPRATAMVGDSIVDVRTARNAGTRMCLARYGFGFANCPPEELAGDELLVDRASELPPVLRRALLTA
jgi:phosphoglycolate phosphatase